MLDEALELLSWREAERSVHQGLFDTHRQSLKLNEKEAEVLGEAILLATAALKSQEDSKTHIETLVTSLMTYVMGEPLALKFEEKLSPEEEVVGLIPFLIWAETSLPYSQQGGGATNLMSFGIRLACLLLQRDLNPLLLLDEPSMNLDLDRWDRLIEFIEDLASKTGIQIIMISHTPASFTSVYKFKKTKTSVKVTKS